MLQRGRIDRTMASASREGDYRVGQTTCRVMRQAAGQTDRQTDKQRERERERERDKERDSQVALERSKGRDENIETQIKFFSTN